MVQSTLKDLTGRRYGKLTVIERALPLRPTRWLCLCDCGQKTIVQSNGLRSGHTMSCGCARNEETSRRMKTHGMSRTGTYRSWIAMLRRCSDPNYRHYHHYGGRGITVHSDWRCFTNFVRDMGIRPKGRSLDRIDVDVGYSKENCRWATPMEQCNNTRRSVIFTCRGETGTIPDLCRLLCCPLKVGTVRCRVFRGWTIEEALFTEARERLQGRG